MDNQIMLFQHQIRFAHRGFYICIDPVLPFVQLPPSFVVEYGSRVTETVTLRDAGGSLFNIWMNKNNQEFSFSNGLSDLRDQYNLVGGGWLDLFYLGQSEFHARILDREFREVTYRNPIILREAGWLDEHYIPSGYSSEPDELNEEFYKEFQFMMKKSHITRKVIPASLARFAMLPVKPSRIVIRDYNGRKFFCCVYWHTQRRAEGCITEGWMDFVTTNRLKEGDVVTMGIDKRDPTVIHIGKKK